MKASDPMTARRVSVCHETLGSYSILILRLIRLFYASSVWEAIQNGWATDLDALVGGGGHLRNARSNREVLQDGGFASQQEARIARRFGCWKQKIGVFAVAGNLIGASEIRGCHRSKDLPNILRAA